MADGHQKRDSAPGDSAADADKSNFASESRACAGRHGRAASFAEAGTGSAIAAARRARPASQATPFTRPDRRRQEAHSALYHFLARAQGEGAKLVLVVTGKGEGRQGDYGEYGGGVLRRAVPMWLMAPDWRSLVIGFEEASRPHGGAGALYVRLRRHGKAER